MKNFSLRKLCIATLAMGACLTAARAQEDESVVCGLDDHTALALSKSADIPKISKTWSGKLKALVIRVSFSDGPYTITDSTINKTNTTINTLYRSMSRNTFEWDWKIHPVTFNAPGTKADYSANFSSLQSYISQQITAAGLKRGTDYDVYVASFPYLNLSWAGLSNMRDADWINGTYSAGVTGHELGHSLGLPHAHSVEAGTDMFGTPGTTSQTNEYGNPYDIMGRGGSTGHFNVLYKWRIGWMDSAEVKEAKAPGVFRVYAQDNAVHKNRLIGLRVPSGNTSYGYWFEYRTISTTARLGSSVMFQGFRTASNLDSWYLDTTPGSRSSGDESDGVLASGKSFKDKYGETTFKVLAINSGTWNEEGWVDVQVNWQGQTVGLSRQAQAPGLFPGRGAGSLDLMGRAVNGLSRAYVLTVKSEGGPSRLVLNR
jgi:hypothetical protein